MALKLPRLRNGAPIAREDGTPTTEFTRRIDEIITQIESNLNDVLSAQAAAAAAQGAANTAQAAANTAAIAAAAAQTAADNAQGASDDAATLQALQASGVDETTVITAHDAGSNVTVSVNAHTRYYGDGTNASVSGGSVTGLAYNTLVYIFYDDAARAGGAVTYQASVSSANVQPSVTNPDRHYVGSVMTPVALAGDNPGNPNFYAP